MLDNSDESNEKWRIPQTESTESFSESTTMTKSIVESQQPNQSDTTTTTTKPEQYQSELSFSTEANAMHPLIDTFKSECKLNLNAHLSASNSSLSYYPNSLPDDDEKAPRINQEKRTLTLPPATAEKSIIITQSILKDRQPIIKGGAMLSNRDGGRLSGIVGVGILKEATTTKSVKSKQFDDSNDTSTSEVVFRVPPPTPLTATQSQVEFEQQQQQQQQKQNNTSDSTADGGVKQAVSSALSKKRVSFKKQIIETELESGNTRLKTMFD